MSRKKIKRRGNEPRIEIDLEGYFKLLIEGKVNDAERGLARVREMGGSEWEQGFVKALEGLLLAQRNPDDKYLFFNRNRGELAGRDLRELKKKFAKYSKDPLNAEYDRGYFSCMVEYLKALERMGPGDGG